MKVKRLPEDDFYIFKIVLRFINLVKDNKGAITCFTVNKLFKCTDIGENPRARTYVSRAFKWFAKLGLVKLVSRNSKGYVYCVDRESPLWIVASRGCTSVLEEMIKSLMKYKDKLPDNVKTYVIELVGMCIDIENSKILTKEQHLVTKT